MINLPGENDMSRLEVREGDDYWMIYFGGGGYYQRKEPTRVTGDPLSPHEIMIIELCKALNTLQQGWVSVEDRLPESDGEYLIVLSNQDNRVTCRCYFGYGHWDAIKKYVTHWMPLPLPPTGE
jgi:hypothetical protein